MKSIFLLVLAGLFTQLASAGLPPEVKATTYLGGSGNDDALALARGPDGRLYVAGTATSRDIPATVTHAFGPAGEEDIFVARLAPDYNSVESVTYVGGTGLDLPYDIAVGANGGIIVTGYTASADFPTLNAVQDTFQGGGISESDAIVFKLTPSGNGLVYSTFLGGQDFDGSVNLIGNEFGRAIFIDQQGSAWVTGETGAPDFPVTQVYNGRPCLADEAATVSVFVSDAWIVKLSPSGALLLSTCIGGTARDVGRDIIVDAAGDVYLNGHTRSADFPVTPGVFQTARSGIGSAYDAYALKLNATLTTPYYSTYAGGSGTEFSQRAVLKDDGSLILSGSSFSADFPVTSDAFQGSLGGGQTDALLFEVSADGSQLNYATYFGDTREEYGFGLATDTLGRLYMLGGSDPNSVARDSHIDPEPGLSMRNARGPAANSDAFLVVFDGNAGVFFTTLGGSQLETGGTRVVFDDRNLAWVSGLTESADFPILDGFQQTLNGTSDGFLARIVLDTDGDGFSDDFDNCLLVPNDDQRDTDSDGYGNACDADLDNSGLINFSDLQIMQTVFFTMTGNPNYNPDADFNGDGAINFLDLQVMRDTFFGVPGPSAQAP